MKTRIIVGVSVLTALMYGCAPTVKHVRYNETKRLYEGTFFPDTTSRRKAKWFVIRELHTHRIYRDSSQAFSAVSAYNTEEPVRRRRKQISRPPATHDRFRKYGAANQYYLGTSKLRNGRYDSALIAFDKALEKNEDLAFHSDLHYLQGIAHAAQDDTAGAQSQFLTFKNLSEQTYPQSFGADHFESPQRYQRVLKSIEDRDFSEWDLNHFTNQVQPEFNPPPYTPGFSYHQSDPLRNISLGFFYSSQTRLGGVIDLRLRLKNGFNPFTGYLYSENYQRLFTGLLYRIYRNPSNTFGVETMGTMSFELWSNSANPAQRNGLPQYTQRLHVGWFPFLRTGVFGGYVYPLFNEYFKYERQGYLLWQETSFFGGLNYHLVEDIGITARYENDRFIVGLFSGSFVVGYSENDLYVNLGYVY